MGKNSGGTKKNRRKAGSVEKRNLPPQPLMIMVLKDGKLRMEWSGEYIKRA